MLGFRSTSYKKQSSRSGASHSSIDGAMQPSNMADDQPSSTTANALQPSIVQSRSAVTGTLQGPNMATAHSPSAVTVTLQPPNMAVVQHPSAMIGTLQPSHMATVRSHSPVSLSQRFANAVGPSTSLMAANGEFHNERRSHIQETTNICAAQLDPEIGGHGASNPASFDLDRSTGYLPADDLAQQPGAEALSLTNGTKVSRPLSLDAFLHCVSSERLNRMPHRGSKWDRAIRLLEGMALQFSASGFGHGSSVSAANGTASQMYAACYDLLRMSSSNLSFVDLAYPILSEVHNVFTLMLRQTSLLFNNEKIRHLLDQLMISVLNLMMETVTCFSDANSQQSERHFRKSFVAIHGLKDQLIDDFWLCQLSPDAVGSADSSQQIAAIRQYLCPYDGLIQTMCANLDTARRFHAEFTCVWFSKSFLEFIRSSETSFWIDGAAGSGKSTLYGWIIESLQNKVAGQDYAVLSHIIDPILPSETAVSSLLKGLLRQAFEQNPGQTRLLSALTKAQDTAVKSDTHLETINALWEAFNVVCEETPRPSMIVIDGLSELSGGEAYANEAAARLINSVSRSPTIRLLLLSNTIVRPPENATRRLTIDASHNHQDIRRVLEKMVPTGSASRLQAASTSILNRSNGNFLWCLLALQYWRSKYDSDVPLQVDNIPRSLDAIISTLVSELDFANPSVRLLLLASAVAARPLNVAEAQSLLSIDLVNRSLVKEVHDVQGLVDHGCGSVMVINNDMVHFRHHVMKQVVCNFAATNLRSSLTDIHVDLASRLLLYLRLSETPLAELSLALSASSTVEDFLQSNHLSSYALRYWTYHAVHADAAGDLDSLCSVGEIRKVFPDTIFAAALEASYWKRQVPYDALHNLKIAVRARQEIFGNHMATLQSIAFLAMQLKETDLPMAVSYFADAFQLALQVLPASHSFVADCASGCLECLRSGHQTTAAGFHSTKSTMLLHMRDRHAKQSGPDSDQAMEFDHLLARHYAETGQTDLCSQIHRDIYKLTVARYGKSSPQAMAAAGQLVISLEKSERSEDQDQFDDLVYDNVMGIFATTDSRRVKASLLKAAAFKSRSDFTNAELVYLGLLHEVSESCSERGTGQNPLQFLEIGLIYAEFLAEQYRDEEARIIIVGLWARFENYRWKDPAEIAVLKDLAVMAQQRGLSTVALTILNSINEWSKANNVDPNELQEVEATISQFARRVVGSNKSGCILSRSTEDVLMQNFESARLDGSNTITSSLIQTIQTLIDSFVLEQRWQDVVQLASSILSLVWPAVLADVRECRAPDDFAELLEEIAFRLARAYSKLDQEATAGHIYLQILRAVRHSTDVDPDFFTDVAQSALHTFDKIGRSKEMIEVAQALVDHYQVTHGSGDPLTVDATYELASLCKKHGENKIAKTCYFSIAEDLKESRYHDRRAIPALQALIEILCAEKHWVQAKEVCKALWETFLTMGKEYEIDEKTFKSLFKGYVQLLDNHLSTDSEVLHQLRAEYRTACSDLYGDHAAITLEASLSLAKSWERQEPGNLNAIHIYESILDEQATRSQPSGPEITEIIQWVESALLDHYCDYIDGDMDKPSLARAIGLQKKQYFQDKAQFGCYSPRSLSGLATYVKFLIKDTEPGSRDAGIQELNHAIEAILQSDCDGHACFDTGIILASAFADCGYIAEGISTAHRIRENMILGIASGLSQSQRSSAHTSERSRLTFSAAFETRIKGSMEAFTNLYSMTLLEITLSETFQVLIRTLSPLELVLARGARLQALLKGHNSSYRGEKIEQQMFDCFLESYGAAFTTATHATKMFFSVLTTKMSDARTETVLPYIACVAINEEVQRLLAIGAFAAAVEVSTAGFDFIRFIGAYGSESYVQYGFQLGLLLGDQPARSSSSSVHSEQLLELSKSVLREVLQLCRTNNFGFDAMDIDVLSKVAAVLGKQQNYHDLEWLLNQLWLSRHKRGSLSQDLIVTLGRRLVDVRFFHGHIDSAIDLAEDILYNLRHVYGPSHRWAVEMMNLLSSMYMSKGDRSAAMAVLDAADLSGGTTMNDRSSAHGAQASDSSHAAKQVKAKIEYLLKFYQQSDNSESSVQQSASLVEELSKRLNAPTLTTEKGDLTAHQPPASWSFADDGSRV